MRFMWLALAVGLAAPSRERGRARAPGHGATAAAGPPPQRQGRRQVERERGPQRLAPAPSPDGRHVFAVEGGAVLVDGRRAHPSAGVVEVLGAPTWRHDGNAVAWVERTADLTSQTRLVVIPEVSTRAEPLAWPLPAALARDVVTWAGAHRVVVGPEPLQPRAVASWTE